MKGRLIQQPWAPWLALALICALQLGINLWWQGRENSFLGSETLVHMEMDQGEYQRVHCIRTTHESVIERAGALLAYQNRPTHNSPFLGLATGLLLGAHDAGPRLPLVIPALMHVVLLVSVFSIARRVRGPWVGVLAAGVVSLVPGVVGASRHFCLDWIMGIAALAVIACLLASERYRRPLPVLAAGIALGLGFLVKGQILFFAALPMGGLLIEGLLEGREDRSLALRSLAGFAGTSLLGAAISALWWWGNLQELIALFGHHADDWKLVATSFGGRFSPLHLGFYPHLLLRDASVPVLLGACAALALQGRSLLGMRGVDGRIDPSGSALRALLLLLASSLVIYGLIMTKNTRYSVPIPPVLGLVLVVGLAGIARTWLRRGLTGALLLFLGLQFAHTSFPLRLVPTPAYSPAALDGYASIQSSDPRVPLLFSFHTSWSHPPLRGVPERQLASIAEEIGAHWRVLEEGMGTRPSRVGLLGTADYPLQSTGWPITYLLEAYLHRAEVFPPPLGQCDERWVNRVVHSIHPGEAIGQLAPLAEACDTYGAMVVLAPTDASVDSLGRVLQQLDQERSQHAMPERQWWEVGHDGQEDPAQLDSCGAAFELAARLPFELRVAPELAELPREGWTHQDYTSTQHHDRRRWALDPHDWEDRPVEALLFLRRMDAPLAPPRPPPPLPEQRRPE